MTQQIDNLAGKDAQPGLALNEQVERLEKAMTARGIAPTPANMIKLGNEAAANPEAAFNLLKDAGLQKDDLLKTVTSSRQFPASQSLAGGAFGGAIWGGALAAPIVWAMDWTKKHTRPDLPKNQSKVLALGGGIGAALGVAATVINNQKRKGYIQEISESLDVVNKGWAEREAHKQVHNLCQNEVLK